MVKSLWVAWEDHRDLGESLGTIQRCRPEPRLAGQQWEKLANVLFASTSYPHNTLIELYWHDTRYVPKLAHIFRIWVMLNNEV